RSLPEDRVQVRIAKHAIWLPLKELGAQPLGSPQTWVAVVHVPCAVPGPTAPQAASVLGMPLLGSSRVASPMSLVSEMTPIRAPALAAPAASIDSQKARLTSTVSSTKRIRTGVMSVNSTRAWPRSRRDRRDLRLLSLTGPGTPIRCSAAPDRDRPCS